jgi:hypothetical protein
MRSRTTNRAPLVSLVAARLEPTLYFLCTMGVRDLHHRANPLSSVEDKPLPRIEFLESLDLHPRAAWRATSRRSYAMTSRRTCNPRQSTSSAPWGGTPADELFEFLEYTTRSLCTSRRDTRPTRTAGSWYHCQPCSHWGRQAPRRASEMRRVHADAAVVAVVARTWVGDWRCLAGDDIDPALGVRTRSQFFLQLVSLLTF